MNVTPNESITTVSLSSQITTDRETSVSATCTEATTSTISKSVEITSSVGMGVGDSNTITKDSHISPLTTLTYTESHTTVSKVFNIFAKMYKKHFSFSARNLIRDIVINVRR